jgi:aminoglycoside phosphotransferase (APT) family kinase protein
MPTEIPTSIQSVINHNGIHTDQLIGKGGEGYVFDRSADTVLKVYPRSTKQYLEQLVSIQQRAASAQLPFETPQIFSIDEYGGIFYTIEQKLTGRQLDVVFPGLSHDQQLKVLRNFVEALEPLKTIDVNDLPYGQLVSTPESIQTNGWPEYLLKKLGQQLYKSKQFLENDVNDFSTKVNLFQKQAHQLLKGPLEKHFVHTDYYLNNVLVNEDLEISSVLDLSAHAVVGDHRLDVASMSFLTLDLNITKDHLDYVHSYVTQTHGKKIIPFLDLYSLYYAFYYSDLHDTDPHSYQWCLSILNDGSRWTSLENV